MGFGLAILPFSWGQRHHPMAVRWKGLTPPPATADRGKERGTKFRQAIDSTSLYAVVSFVEGTRPLLANRRPALPRPGFDHAPVSRGPAARAH
jgi:hypothetical protein